MAANWEEFNIGLGDIGKVLGNRAREQRTKEEAIQMLYQKALIENEIKKQNMIQSWEMIQNLPFFGGGRQASPSSVDMVSGRNNIIDIPENDYQVIPEINISEEGMPRLSLKPSLTQEAQVRQKTKEARATRRASLEEEMSVKRETLSKDLDSFMALDDIIQQARGTGLSRFGAGLRIGVQSISQKSRLGKTAAAYDAASKRLRVQLVRAAGDVGNINIVEQEAAEKLIPSKWDDAGTASIKRAYLRQVAKAINDNSPNELKRVLDGIGVGYVNIGTKNKYENIWGD